MSAPRRQTQFFPSVQGRFSPPPDKIMADESTSPERSIGDLRASLRRMVQRKVEFLEKMTAHGQPSEEELQAIVTIDRFLASQERSTEREEGAVPLEEMTDAQLDALEHKV
jgi:hypothetical protein